MNSGEGRNLAWHETLEMNELLALLKTSVRNYAIAITETATPELRGVLTNHLLRGIQSHERIFTYMLKMGLYPSYNLEQLLTNDLQTAQKALHMD